MNRRTLLLGLNDLCVNDDAYVRFSCSDRLLQKMSISIQLDGQNINNDGTLYYSFDGINWSEWDKSLITNTFTASSTGEITIYIYLRGLNNSYVKSTGSGGFIVSGQVTPGFRLDVSCDGCVEALLDYKKYARGQNITKDDSTFAYLFDGCTNLVSIPKLSPKNDLTPYCYLGMFAGCTSLTKLPELPSTNLPSYCYFEMFWNCSNIKLSETYDSTTYKYLYRIPSYGTGSGDLTSAQGFVAETGGTYQGDIDLNKNYYCTTRAFDYPEPIIVRKVFTSYTPLDFEIEILNQSGREVELVVATSESIHSTRMLNNNTVILDENTSNQLNYQVRSWLHEDLEYDLICYFNDLEGNRLSDNVIILEANI